MPFNIIDKGIKHENKDDTSGIGVGRIHAWLGIGGYGRVVETDVGNQCR